ncbi:MAG: trypsin-like peptidase domain-containing protein [Clostridia bacterium]|nr:trypsin-like peptidase domain-containing protein [Clostridia bacterium]
MNEFDAEKHNLQQSNTDDPSHNDQMFETYRENSQNTQEVNPKNGEHIQSTTSGNGYTFIQNGTPDGRGYTTPEGAHGFVYSPPPAPKGNGIGRNLIIATCVIGTLLLIMGFCFLGAWAAARALNGTLTDSSDARTEDTRESGTAGDFVIVDGSDAADDVTEEADPEYDSEVTFTETSSLNEEKAPDIVFADTATVDKKEPERKDEDGNGKADVAYDENGNVITSAGNSMMTVPTIIAQVSASVVEISTETLVQSNWIGQYITGGAGSGVIIAKEGYIITNHHVVDGADSIVVRLNDGTEFSASLVGSDEETDVAILWIDPGEYELTVAKLGSSYDLVAGEEIIAIGNPLGSLGGTVTEGIISATERQISVDGNDMTLLQISAPINPGNSGGGLFNIAGELVGVVNAKMSSEEIEGLGFAIPVDTAYEIACELIEYRYVRGRATTGLTLVDVSNVQTAYYYFNKSRYTGVYVSESVSEVLQYGDLIVSVNGQKITESSEVFDAVEGLAVGDTVELEIYRTAEKKQLTVTLTLMEYIPDYLTEKAPALEPAA